MLAKVITGGQAGAEKAAWSAARRAGLATGGYMPRGFATDEGPAPRVAALFGAIEFPFDDARRMRANLKHADGLLLFGNPESPEGALALSSARRLSKPTLNGRPGVTLPADVVRWLDIFEIATLCVAAEPASHTPGLAPKVESFLGQVFARARRSPGGA